jgi:hypothetical protein
MGGPGVCTCMGLLPPPAARGVLSLPRLDARNPIRHFCTWVFLRANLCRILFYRRLACKLEMPSMRAGVFPSSVLSQSPVWRALFSLRSAEMVRFGHWRYYFKAEVSLWMGNNRSASSFTALPRPMERIVASMSNMASMMVLIVGGIFDMARFRS